MVLYLARELITTITRQNKQNKYGVIPILCDLRRKDIFELKPLIFVNMLFEEVQ